MSREEMIIRILKGRAEHLKACSEAELTALARDPHAFKDTTNEAGARRRVYNELRAEHTTVLGILKAGKPLLKTIANTYGVTLDD